ncbi:MULTISPECIES: acyl carrier protein [Actinosynnema]|uniref:acyl carrier protein n=1 Tax=Actinosynnema TaxID=40566 RepID=UPI0020A3327F|nr:phosphopantetheine-binding protein [Actinosynnema pretiosum]MCP2098869.1 acyl carrier protein [Actinosynnema pretiosum]
MTDEQLLDLLADFARQLNPLGPEVDVRTGATFDDLGIDSLSFVDLLFKLEREHGVDVPDEALPGIETVGDLLAFVAEPQRA